MSIIALLTAALLFAPTDGKIMATDDWVGLSILEVGGETSGRSPYYVRVAAGDLDGDGLADDAVLKLTCDGGALKQAHYAVTGPRDAASGQASGKRMHKPITVVKEWGAATPQLMAMKPTYDVKKVEGTGARVADGGGWTAISLGNTDGLCTAVARATKTRSNIQNN
jgi:hypothetical protein